MFFLVLLPDFKGIAGDYAFAYFIMMRMPRSSHVHSVNWSYTFFILKVKKGDVITVYVNADISWYRSSFCCLKHLTEVKYKLGKGTVWKCSIRSCSGFCPTKPLFNKTLCYVASSNLIHFYPFSLSKIGEYSTLQRCKWLC